MAKKHISNDDEENKVRENIQRRFSEMFSGKHQPLSNMTVQEVEALQSRLAELEAKLSKQQAVVTHDMTRSAQEVREVQPTFPAKTGDVFQQLSQSDRIPVLPNAEFPEKIGGRSGRFNLWQRLIEPVRMISGVAERRKARLVSAILLAMMVALSIGSFMNAFILPNPAVALVLLGSDVAMGIAYLLSRSRHYRLAAPLLLLIFAVIPILIVSSGTVYTSEQLLTNLIFNILIVLLCSALMSTRTTVFFAIGNILLLLLIPVFIPAISSKNMIMPVVFNGIISGFILVLTHHHKLLEKDQFEEVAQLTRTLETRNSALSARTRDLNLATEATRSLSSLRELDTLLAEAVNLIQSRFNLYHTQVYLADNSGRTLILRAATGDAGSELLRNGHHLTIGFGSINGRVAAEKRTIVVADTSQSTDFLLNPLLSKTRSQMSVPLLAGDTLLGVLNMQNDVPGTLNMDNLPAFETLAGQLTIAIQNAKLFDEVGQARSEIEARVRSSSEQGWRAFLDAIHRSHRIGFEFDESKVISLKSELLSTVSDADKLHLPIMVAGAKIGEIQLPGGTEHNLTTSELELLQTTGAQLAQHVENLRLLAQAERYRVEAEQAVRRLTHEGWENFLQASGELQSGYQYDLTEVKPLSNNNHDPSDYAIKHPMAVGNEVIGELAVNSSSQSEETAEVVAAVAEQLSGHIENLRLSELNEKRAQREQTLRQITSSLRSSNDAATIMRTAVRELGSIMGRRAVVQLADPRRTNQMESASGDADKSDTPAYQS